MVHFDNPREHVFWGVLYARLPNPLHLDYGPEQGQVLIASDPSAASIKKPTKPRDRERSTTMPTHVKFLAAIEPLV